ncbi:MAG: FAD-dependent monooxygenase [Flavobacteriales bacterium]|nr:FAD-dependent monooxygenase [Flavobacteriales bacterium]
MKHVTIVGGGLVGSLLAVYMARRGMVVNVYERRPDPRENDVYGGRSINLVVSHRGWTALRGAGVDQAVREITVPVHARMTHDREGHTTRLPYSIDNKAIHSVSRGELNCRLLTEAEKWPNVHLHFDHRCVDVHLDTATCTFTHDRSGGSVVVNGDVVFGTDGAFSAVRQEMMKGRFNFSQEYIEHDYKEIAFGPNPDGSPRMDPQCLHIWPRQKFMMMGLANLDGGFTGTLFMPHAGEHSFERIKDERDLMDFFQAHFADAIPMLPDLKEQYFRNHQSSLVIVRCDPWVHKDKVALVGDSAHAIVPFYGEGMNAGFEDCRVLNDLFDRMGEGDVGRVLDAYNEARVVNGNAIADLSLRNFVEMRDLVADPSFILRKKIEGHIQRRHPDKWLPLYSQVKFTDIPYVDAWNEGLRHDRIMEEVLAMPNIEEQWDGEAVEKMVLTLLDRA